MTTTLIVYIVLNGKMQQSRIKQTDEFTCALNATAFMSAKPDGEKFKPLFAECVSKEKKVTTRKGAAPTKAISLL